MINAVLPPAPQTQHVIQRDVPPQLYPLATYAAQRALRGKPLLENLRPLLAADETVRETRATLWAGRGNVREDLTSNNYDSSRRTFASRALSAEFDIPSVTDLDYADISTAIAATAGSGNCGEHAAIAMRLHGNPERLQDGNVLSTMSLNNPEYDHAWVVLALAADENSQEIVIDPWMRGPAVMREDAQPLHNSEVCSTLATVSVDEARDLYKNFRFSSAWFSNRADDIHQQVSNMEEAIETGIREDDIYDEVDVTSEAFRVSASSAAAQQATNHLLVSIPTVAAARELGANVKGAAAFTRDVFAKLAQTAGL